MDRIVEATKTLPMHEKIALLGIVSGGMKEMDTNEVYLNYHKLGEERGIKPLTKVRVSSFISELDMLGLITARKSLSWTLRLDQAYYAKRVKGKSREAVIRVLSEVLRC